MRLSLKAGEDHLFSCKKRINYAQMAQTILFTTIRNCNGTLASSFSKMSNLQTFSSALKSVLLWSK